MKKALLLDRDGVINEDQGRVYKVEDIIFMDGIFDVCRKFLENNYLIIIITNQAGIGRGLYTESDFEHLTQWMEEKFQSEGVEISKTYFCPFHPTKGLGDYRKESFDRKPNPGMILKAKDEFDLDLEKSVLVGDKESDIEAANRVSMENTVLYFGPKNSGKTSAKYFINSLHELESLFLK